MSPLTNIDNLKIIKIVNKFFSTNKNKITFSGAAGAQIKSDDLIRTEEAQKQLNAFEKYLKTGEFKCVN